MKSFHKSRLAGPLLEGHVQRNVDTGKCSIVHLSYQKHRSPLMRALHEAWGCI